MELAAYTGETHLWDWKDASGACDYRAVLAVLHECMPQLADYAKECAYCGNAKPAGCGCGADRMVERPRMLFWHKMSEGFWQQKSLKGPFWNGHPLAETVRGTQLPGPVRKSRAKKKNL